MKLIKYLALIIILWGIPSFFSYDVAIGSKFSLLMVVLLVLYFAISKKRKIVLPFVILGLLYFTISGLISIEGEVKFYINDIIKYFIVIICGAELARDTSKKELFIVLTLGSMSILAHAAFFQGDFGRYSGFYLDPNGAGFICILAYALSFSVEPKQLKIIGQFIVTLAGFLTFSRTFIILWLLASFAAVASDKKNAMNFGIGIGALIVVFTVGSFLRVDEDRFNALKNLFNDDNTTSTKVLNKDSRLDTWAVYYEMILDNPIVGNGYRKLGGSHGFNQGVHNSYLMVLGESGIFPFLMFVGIYLTMLIQGVKAFKVDSYKLVFALAISILLLTTHNYFDNFVLLFLSLWLFIKATERVDAEVETEEPIIENETI